jgi:hypothetical protein
LQVLTQLNSMSGCQEGHDERVSGRSDADISWF